MKMTNIEAWSCLQTAANIRESGKLGFAIAKNMRKLSNELVEYDAKRRELIQTYGTDLGDGRFSFSPEAAERFNAEISEYDSMTFDFEPMTVSEEVFCGGNLTSDQMYALMWMCQE